MEWGPNSVEDTREFIRKAIAFRSENPRTFFELAVTLRDTGQVIGAAGIRIKSTLNLSGDMGYTIHPAYWGKGLATEAAKGLIQFGFETLKMHKIWATCRPANLASARVLQKAGMSQEGHLRHEKKVRGEWVDSLQFSILEHDARP